MSFTVYYSNPALTAQAGFGKVAHLPCIFDGRPGYHRQASAYLIDRGLGYWNPLTRGTDASSVPPTYNTILNYAHWLANFLDWANIRGVNLATCSYGEHVHGRYQKGMAEGSWSRDGKGLGARTINVRVQQACDYLTWLSDKGLRPPFAIPMHTQTIRLGSAMSAIGHQSAEIQVREGKVRQNKKNLRMPTDSELTEWLEKVYARAGYSKGLMCEVILLTALRREEAACLRMDTLPEDPVDWHRSNSDAPLEEQRVRVSIKFGAKGPCYGYDHGDKIGPERSIWMPLTLAERIHEYRKRKRNAALKLWVNGGGSLEGKKARISDTVHLFLDEKTGKRLNAKSLYNAWTSVELPYKGWSPHLGRDWWACSVLWNEMKKHVLLAKLDMSTATALLESTAMSIIRLQIQPQLGHADDSTTMMYLEWIVSMLSVNVALELERADDSAHFQDEGKVN